MEEYFWVFLPSLPAINSWPKPPYSPLINVRTAQTRTCAHLLHSLGIEYDAVVCAGRGTQWHLRLWEVLVWGHGITVNHLACARLHTGAAVNGEQKQPNWIHILKQNNVNETCLPACFVSVVSSVVVLFVPSASISTCVHICSALQVLWVNNFNDYSENEWVTLEENFGLCVTVNGRSRSSHTETCVHRPLFSDASNYLHASHMVFIDPCPCYTPPTPHPLSLLLCLRTDGEGMMECWRVDLWFPGSWSGFIRSGCDNTPADGPTKRLSYKHRSANKKLSWKKQSAKQGASWKTAADCSLQGLFLTL